MVQDCKNFQNERFLFHNKKSIFIQMYNVILLLYYIQRKIFFRATIFLYSPCPNLEGIKDALSYKFRRLTIGQNCCAVCTNEVARA